MVNGRMRFGQIFTQAFCDPRIDFQGPNHKSYQSKWRRIGNDTLQAGIWGVRSGSCRAYMHDKGSARTERQIYRVRQCTPGEHKASLPFVGFDILAKWFLSRSFGAIGYREDSKGSSCGMIQEEQPAPCLDMSAFLIR
jgi:hypothetical protein